MRIRGEYYLINSTRDQTRNVLLAIEDVRKSFTKAWRSLHGRKCYLSNTTTFIKAKYSLDLVECDMFLNLYHHLIEFWALTGEVKQISLSHEINLLLDLKNY